MVHFIEIPPFQGCVFEYVDASVPWINRDGAPRDECFMSRRTDTYTYGKGPGARTYAPIPYMQTIDDLLERVIRLTGIDYEACFLNRYADEHKHLGWHADDSPSIDHRYGIAVVSFGAERELWVRENPVAGEAPPLVEHVLMRHGSLLMMPAGMQQTHQHRIPKHSAKCGPRISLTFRKLI